jgi:alpha-amylase/alpha-mannosidase (GH57 family)
MKYVAIFHGNLNYAYLTEDRYEFVIRSAYEMTFDTMRERFPGTKYVFEASGYTLEHMARKTPDVLAKLKLAISRGECEFMGSPYAHPMLPNFPKEDGTWSIRFSNEVYEKILGFRPRSFWNPECGWRHYIPDQVRATGYANLIADFEAYSRSCGPDGRPLRPEIYEKEHSKTPAFYNFGFKYDLPGTEQTIHFPFANCRGVPRGSLRVFLRTDRIAQFGVRYFMGMEGYTFEKYMELIRRYSAQPQGEPEGALIIFADDAEYIGTNGWFRLKYQNKPDNVFEATPESRQKLIDLISATKKLGEFATFDDACRLPPLAEEIMFDDDSAWHGARASTWANTPMARLLRPWQDLVRAKLQRKGSALDEETQRLAWFHLTNSFNSDGQWPPTLPDSPHIVHPFNYEYCFENLLKAELLVGGVDRSKLKTDPVKTLQEILGMQQDMVAAKAAKLVRSGPKEQKAKARRAAILVAKTRDVRAIRASKTPFLQPSEYRVRADSLVEARRLVGGVLIEKADLSMAQKK